MAALDEQHTLAVVHALELLEKQTQQLHMTIDEFVSQVTEIGNTWLEQKEGNVITAEEMSLLIEKTAQFVTGRGTDFKVEPDFVRNILANMQQEEGKVFPSDTAHPFNSSENPVSEDRNQIPTVTDAEVADSQLPGNSDKESNNHNTKDGDCHSDVEKLSTEEKNTSISRQSEAEEAITEKGGDGKETARDSDSQIYHLSKQLMFVSGKCCQLEKKIDWLTAKQNFTEGTMDNASGRLLAFEKMIKDEVAKVAKQGEQLSRKLNLNDTQIRKITSNYFDIGSRIDTMTTQLNDVIQVAHAPADMIMTVNMNNEKLTEHSSLLWKISSQQAVLEKQLEGVSSVQFKMDDNQGRRMSHFQGQIQMMSRQQADNNNRFEGISGKLSAMKKQLEECSTKQSDLVKCQNEKVQDNEKVLQKIFVKQLALEKNVDILLVLQSEIGELPGKRLGDLEKQLTEMSEKQMTSEALFESTGQRLSTLEKQFKTTGKQTMSKTSVENSKSLTKKLEDLEGRQSLAAQQIEDISVKQKTLEKSNSFLQDCQSDTAKQLKKLSSRQFELEKGFENSSEKQAQLEKNVTDTQNGLTTNQSELSKKVGELSSKQMNSFELHGKKLTEAEKQIKKLRTDVGKLQDKRSHGTEKEISGIHVGMTKQSDALVKLSDEVMEQSDFLKDVQQCLNSLYSNFASMEKDIRASREGLIDNEKYSKTLHNTMGVIEKALNGRLDDLQSLHDELASLVNSTYPSVTDLAKKVVSTDIVMQDFSAKLQAIFSFCQDISTDLGTLMSSPVPVKSDESQIQKLDDKKGEKDLEVVGEGEMKASEVNTAKQGQVSDMKHSEEGVDTHGMNPSLPDEVSQNFVDERVKGTHVQDCAERVGFSGSTKKQKSIEDRLKRVENLINDVKHIKNLAHALDTNDIQSCNGLFVNYAENLDKRQTESILYRLGMLEMRQVNVEAVVKRINILETKTGTLDKNMNKTVEVVHMLSILEEKFCHLEDRVKMAEGDKNLIAKVDFLNEFNERLQFLKRKSREPKPAAVMREVEHLVRALINYVESSCVDAIKRLSIRVNLAEERVRQGVNENNLKSIAERIEMLEKNQQVVERVEIQKKEQQMSEVNNVESVEKEGDDAGQGKDHEKEDCGEIKKNSEDSREAEKDEDSTRKMRGGTEQKNSEDLKERKECEEVDSDNITKDPEETSLDNTTKANDRIEEEVGKDRQEEETKNVGACEQISENCEDTNLDKTKKVGDKIERNVDGDKEKEDKPTKAPDDKFENIEDEKSLDKTTETMRAVEPEERDEDHCEKDDFKPGDFKNETETSKIVEDLEPPETNQQNLDSQENGAKSNTASGTKNDSNLKAILNSVDHEENSTKGHGSLDVKHQEVAEHNGTPEINFNDTDDSGKVQPMSQEKRSIQAMKDTVEDVMGRLQAVENDQSQKNTPNGMQEMEKRLNVIVDMVATLSTRIFNLETTLQGSS